MSLKDKLKRIKSPDWKDREWDVFKPFRGCKGKPVFISTWGLSDPLRMSVVVEWLEAASKVYLLVGYSKATHPLVDLLDVCRSYQKLGWQVKVLPSFHTKLWVIGGKTWVGSSNFVPATCVNHMWAVPYARVKCMHEVYWAQAAPISSLKLSTDLALVPQARIHA